MMGLILEALEAMGHNVRWMSWNLFLGLLPLALSFWLFRKPRSRWLLWGTWVLLGASFVPSTRHVLGYLRHIVQDVGKTYVLGAIVITLALMALDIWVLRQRGVRSLRWWGGFFWFIAFLPNAPYVLTDIIHLIEQIKQNHSVWTVTLALIPQYLAFMLAGFGAYVLSVMNLGYYLKQQGWSRFILATETIVHALSAIGIYLGRFIRFNSWDILTNPDELVNTVMNDLIGKRPVVVMAATFVVIAVLYWLMKQVILGISQRFYSSQSESEPIGESATSADSIDLRF
ncbi:DUF1361 domain-containing protein [Microcoleus sp. LEGE 07076]|uniref:DUF1361 domain-containing protein n=1 Tax=Microcoleus sp. LEGE 07076 TaxID=915322 RepID=UPI001880E575|nr:DUF1361 domain-containing protein [Microcoleus sp. LEGE 07076]MBE9185338.1 DUF1361 domain-containing protein [Microcoleus sp. LEGE 07076]